MQISESTKRVLQESLLQTLYTADIAGCAGALGRPEESYEAELAAWQELRQAGEELETWHPVLNDKPEEWD